MFSLIIVIISVALVAILALATIYYGGDQFNKGAENASVSKALSQGGQIHGAFEVYRADHQGQLPTGTQAEIIQQLIDAKYLSAWPNSEAANANGSQWSLMTHYAVASEVSENACATINKKLGIPSNPIPSCSDTSYEGKSYCCQN